MKNVLQILFCILFVSGSLSSCSEELDFNQLNELEAIPVVEASILYLEATEDVINRISETNVYSQNFNFEAFSSKVFSERVLDGTLTFVVENTTSKELVITVTLLDSDDNITDTEIFSVPSAPTALITREIAYGNNGKNINIIKTLTAIRVTARNLSDNTSVSDLPEPLITLKSSGKFRVRLK